MILHLEFLVNSLMHTDHAIIPSFERNPILLRIVCALLIYFVLVSCAAAGARNHAANQPAPYPATSPEATQPSGTAKVSSYADLRTGEHERRLAGNRKYLLYIPASYDARRPAPLLLFFHGGGGHMEHAASSYGWLEKSDKEGFIVAFPNGASRLPRGRFATWNAGECCGYARDRKSDDVDFVRQVIADIQGQANVDQEQIFAAGMSNGGMLVYRLACEMPDTFKAVASVAGTDNTISCTPSRPISIMHIHARDDTHVLYEGGAGKDAFRDLSKVTDFTSVPETINRWILRNRAQRTPQRILDVPGAYADLYTSKQNDAQIELIVTETGGHSWPGGKRVRGKEPSRAIHANDIIWEFFLRQVRR